MKLLLLRYSSRENSTLGIISTVISGVTSFFSYTLEDEYREYKKPGATRIPAGEYEIKLRNVGSVNKTYAARYGNHKGMLWLQDVNNFEWIYIHEGNTHTHTEGCILVGETAVTRVKGDHTIRDSGAAYARLYALLLPYLERGERVTIVIQDSDTPPETVE